MFEYIVLSLFSLAFLGSLIGWGRFAITAVTGNVFQNGLSQNLGVIAAIGAASFTVFISILALFHLALGAVISVALFCGLLFLIRDYNRIPTSHNLIIMAAASFFIVVALPLASVHWHWNACDDDVAYVPLVIELVQSGSIQQAFSQRSMSSYGGLVFLQSPYLYLVGHRAVPIPDMVIAPTILLLTILSSAQRRLALATAVVLPGFIFLLLHPIPRVNSAPSIFLAVYFVAIWWSLDRLYRAEEKSLYGLLPIIALLVAGLWELRLSPIPPLMISIFIFMLARTYDFRTTSQNFGLILVLIVAFMAPAMLLQWIHLGTPLYPLLAGNANPEWHGMTGNGIGSLRMAVTRSFEVFRDSSKSIPAILLLCLFAARRSSRITIVAAELSAVATTLSLSLALPLFAAQDIWRYSLPLYAALPILALAIELAQESTSDARHAEWRNLEGYWRTALPGIGIFVLAMSFQGYWQSSILPSGKSDAALAAALRFLNYLLDTRSSQIGRDTYTLSGWYYKSGSKWLSAKVTAPNGMAADVRLERNASPNLYPDPEASHQRFVLQTHCRDECTLELKSEDGEIVQKKLAEFRHVPIGFGIGFDLGQGHVHVEIATTQAYTMHAILDLIDLNNMEKPHASFRAEYLAVQGALPTGASILAMVDFPDLLDFRRNSIQLIDIPGFASPPPGIPYFKGILKKLQYLRNIGLDYIVVGDPSQSICMYNEANWKKLQQTPEWTNPYAPIWAPYFLDWFEDIRTLRKSAPASISVFGSLWLINVEMALKSLDRTNSDQ